MKIKNIMFTGFMAAILGATGAHAAISVASQGYVDAKVDTATTAVTNLQQTVETNKTDAAAATKKVADDLAEYETANDQAVSGLGTRLDTAEGTISGHTTTIGEHATAIQDINEELGKMATSETVTGLTTDVGALKTQVGEGSVSDRIAAAVATETSARESADTALQDKIDAINDEETGILADAKAYADEEDAKIEGVIGSIEKGKTVQGLISENKSAIERIEEAYIAKPAACQNTYCVLSVNGENISWMPLTEPVANFMGE